MNSILKTGGLSFDMQDFTNLNWRRNIEVFKGENKPNTYFITALVEELGELAGAIKKLDRGFNVREEKKTLEKWKLTITTQECPPEPTSEILKLMWTQEKLKKISDEAADNFIYLALFCTNNGINLAGSVIAKFNQVSLEMEAGDEFIIH